MGMSSDELRHRLEDVREFRTVAPQIDYDKLATIAAEKMATFLLPQMNAMPTEVPVRQPEPSPYVQLAPQMPSVDSGDGGVAFLPYMPFEAPGEDEVRGLLGVPADPVNGAPTPMQAPAGLAMNPAQAELQRQGERHDLTKRFGPMGHLNPQDVARVDTSDIAPGFRPVRFTNTRFPSEAIFVDRNRYPDAPTDRIMLEFVSGIYDARTPTEVQIIRDACPHAFEDDVEIPIPCPIPGCGLVTRSTQAFADHVGRYHNN